MFDQVLFFLSASLTLGGGIAVCLSRNLMRSCLCLLGSLFGIAGLYATLGADYLAATQLVVYAGGVVILMLFAVMLTGGAKESWNRTGLDRVSGMGDRKTFTIALLSAGVVILVALKMFMGLGGVKGTSPSLESLYEPTVEKLGMLLATDHILAFEISSILLLGALVGAAVIARPKGR